MNRRIEAARAATTIRGGHGAGDADFLRDLSRPGRRAAGPDHTRHRRRAPGSAPRGLADVAADPSTRGATAPSTRSTAATSPRSAMVWSRGLSAGLQQGTPPRPRRACCTCRTRATSSRRSTPLPATSSGKYRRDRPDDLADYMIGSLVDTKPQPRHLRQPDHRHQRRRLRLRPRRRNGRTGLGDRDPRLPGPPRQPDFRPHHRQREGDFPAGAATPRGGPPRLRNRRPRRGDGARSCGGRRLIPGPGEPGNETWGSVPFEERGHVGAVDGAGLRPGAEPGLHRDVRHLAAGAEVLSRRNREHPPLPQLDAGPRRRHGRDIVWHYQHLNDHWDPRPPVRAAADSTPRCGRIRRS